MAYALVVAASIGVALAPQLDASGVPVAVTFLAIVCFHRAVRPAAAGAAWIVAEALLAVFAVGSAARPFTDMAGNPNSFAGAAGLLLVGVIITGAEVARASQRRATARNAAAWQSYKEAAWLKELAEAWHALLVQSQQPGKCVRWIVAASPVGSKTHALLEEPGSTARENRWLWGTWQSQTWVVVDTRTDEVTHWAHADAPDAWNRLGPRAG